MRARPHDTLVFLPFSRNIKTECTSVFSWGSKAFDCIDEKQNHHENKTSWASLPPPNRMNCCVPWLVQVGSSFVFVYRSLLCLFRQLDALSLLNRPLMKWGIRAHEVCGNSDCRIIIIVVIACYFSYTTYLHNLKYIRPLVPNKTRNWNVSLGNRFLFFFGSACTASVVALFKGCVFCVGCTPSSLERLASSCQFHLNWSPFRFPSLDDWD